jgi:protein deglycase
MSCVCVLLAPGFEEIEAVTIIDVLRRADIDTTALGIEGRRVEGSHGIVLHADAVLGERAGETWDMVVLPGGMPGSKNLRDTPEVQALLKRQHEEGGRLAAICAAPIALSAAGVLEGRRATSYPAFRDEIRCAQYLEQPVVVDGTVITSRGPGTAIDFALELVKVLKNAATAQQLAERMLVQS